MNGEPRYDLDGSSPKDMVDALVMAGADVQAATLFTNAIVNKTLPGLFAEVFGSGGIFKDANGLRRALNVEVLGALDTRTYKPNRSPWDFDLKSDRKMDKQLVDTLQPTWLIVSPP